MLWSNFSSPDNGTVRSEPIEATREPAGTAEYSANDDSEAALVEQTRQQLFAGLSNAASRGILEPATPDLSGFIDDAEVPQEQQIFDSSETEVSAVTPQAGNIRITTSGDSPDAVQSAELMTSGAVCAAPDKVMVSGWGGDDPFHIQVAALRSILFSDIDRLDQSVAIGLARLYIFFGFGAEAKKVLNLSDDLILDNPELMDLADIMEHGFAPNPRFVHRFADCDSDLALWAAMAAPDLPSEQILNEAAALRTLAALPDHLKQFIAPALSQRLADRGSLESASIALRNLEWNEPSQASSADLAQAKIEKQAGNVEKAEDLLGEVIEDDAAETPEAIIELVDSRVQEGKSIPADVALLIETYAFEWRDSPIAKELQRAHVIASAYSDQFSKAFDAMANEMVANDPSLLAELQSHTFSAVSLNADDITFLEAFFSKFPEDAMALRPVAVEATVERLLSLGFATEAEALLSKLANEGLNENLELLRAEAFLALQQPEEAMAVLNNVQNEAAVPLRAQALFQLGQNREAYGLFQTINADQDAARSAWLANEWSELVSSDAPVFGDARLLSEEAIPAVVPQDGMLETIGTAVEQSSSARTTLEELLSGLQVQP